MSAKIIDGRALSAALYEHLKTEVDDMKTRGVTPGLAVILVGNDPGSQVYVRNKARACEKIGLYSEVIRMKEETTQAELLREVERVNRDPRLHGLLVQLPLPKQIDEKAVIASIDPKKDVDAFHAMNTGALMSGTKGMLPCTPHGVIEMLKATGVDMNGADAVVLGRSNIVGKPVALLLMRENATVTICHSKTRALGEITRRADILVAAIGRPNFVTADMIKPGAVVIDVGMNRLPDGKLCGEVDFEAAREVAGAITPVPGGVGPMTIAMLIANTVEAARGAGA